MAIISQSDPNKSKTSEAKAKREWQNATRAALEKMALEVEKEFADVCVKLKALAPKVVHIREAFNDHPRGTLTIRGCKSFPEFCIKRLHRDPSTVYKTLAGYTKPQREKKAPKRDEPKKLVLAEQDKQRIYAAGAAGIHLVEALRNGDEEAQRKATEEIMVVSEAQPLRSVIFAEQDIRHEVLTLKLELVKVKKLFLKLLGKIAEVDRYQTLPAHLTQTVASIRMELAIDPASFGLDDDGGQKMVW